MTKWNENNLGKFLIDFLYYFGFYYEYQYEMNTGVNMLGGRNPSLDFSDPLDSIDPYMMALHIFDPLNKTNNVGKG